MTPVMMDYIFVLQNNRKWPNNIFSCDAISDFDIALYLIELFCEH